MGPSMTRISYLLSCDLPCSQHKGKCSPLYINDVTGTSAACINRASKGERTLALFELKSLVAEQLWTASCEIFHGLAQLRLCLPLHAGAHLAVPDKVGAELAAAGVAEQCGSCVLIDSVQLRHMHSLRHMHDAALTPL